MTVKKKGILLCFLFLNIIFLGGCQTVKGAAYGTGSTVKSAAKGIGATAKGVVKDTKNLWQTILKADNWVKKNFW